MMLTPGGSVAMTPGVHAQADPFNTDSPGSSTPGPSRHSRGRTGSAVTSSSSQSRSTATNGERVKLQPANPFFDNIRQNLELSHGGITERIPLDLGEDVIQRAADFPSWLRSLISMSNKESAETLAGQFYEIELGEQKRLQAVMDWHARGSGAILDDAAGRSGAAGKGRSEQRAKDAKEVDRLSHWGEGFRGETDEEDYNPFSITAGVERGSKNR
jgi:hypothetical protein